jgi:hypothetical protein
MQHGQTDKSVPKGLVDEAFERYLGWRQACAAVSHAYEQWSRAPADQHQFAVYRSALDQEESAAALYGAVLSPLPMGSLVGM